jgi:hypothetical protein
MATPRLLQLVWLPSRLYGRSSLTHRDKRPGTGIATLMAVVVVVVVVVVDLVVVVVAAFAAAAVVVVVVVVAVVVIMWFHVLCIRGIAALW